MRRTGDEPVGAPLAEGLGRVKLPLGQMDAVGAADLREVGVRAHQEHQAALEEGQGQDADTREDDVDASPAARAKARQLDVDLAELGEGSGEDGRILVADVEAAAQDRE